MAKLALIAAVLLVGGASAATANENAGGVPVAAMATAAVETHTRGNSDQQARAAFLTWKKLDTPGVATPEAGASLGGVGSHPARPRIARASSAPRAPRVTRARGA